MEASAKERSDFFPISHNGRGACVSWHLRCKAAMDLKCFIFLCCCWHSILFYVLFCSNLNGEPIQFDIFLERKLREIKIIQFFKSIDDDNDDYIVVRDCYNILGAQRAQVFGNFFMQQHQQQQFAVNMSALMAVRVRLIHLMSI